MLLEQCADQAKRNEALDEIVKEVQAETTSLTTVPKPLKFLSKHYARICELHEQITDATFKVRLSCVNCVRLALLNSLQSLAWLPQTTRHPMH